MIEKLPARRIKMRDIRRYQYKRIDTLELQKYLSINDYPEFAKAVGELLGKGVLSPIKSSKLNGKIPALYNKYNIIPEDRDHSLLEDELKHSLNYQLNNQYYMKHPEQYEEDRHFVLKLSSFLNEKSSLLDVSVSENERSFQIWQREKYLKAEGGKRILKNLCFPFEKLNIYPTTEPLAYFSIHKNAPQKILILENKDTFYTLRRHLMAGRGMIFGEDIATVIYGRGKDIWKTFNDFKVCVEPYMLFEGNEILYLGDLDYEGIFIYEQLHNSFRESFLIHPFEKAYCYMIDKCEHEKAELSMSKEKQNKNLKGVFSACFSPEYRKKIMDILKSGRYIPQEIINLSDLSQEE